MRMTLRKAQEIFLYCKNTWFKILFSECHGVEIKDLGGKFNLLIDLGDRKYEVQSEFKGTRDTWFEYIKNSRKTAKDVKTSITKRPRNINKLCNILESNGEEKLKKVCEDEKDKILNNYKDIKDFETLSFVIDNLQKPLLQVLLHNYYIIIDT